MQEVSQDKVMLPENMTIVPRVSEKIGRYRVLSELGRGAMGRVYLAKDPNIDRKVALKVLYPDVMDVQATKEFQKRFVTEARAAGRLNHPGIVTVYDAGTDPDTGHSFIAMELVEGKPLEQILAEEKRLPPARAVAITADVARALDYAHRQGVVHRDVKPANILVSAEGHVKVTDFGVAKLGVESQTMAGHVLGTPAFMSPEQVRSEPIDGRSDLFSLGTVLYQSLTGHNPFSADSIAGIGYKIANADSPSIRAYDPELPKALAAVVDRVLKKLPEERYGTGAELAEALVSLGPLSEAPPSEVTVTAAAASDPALLGATVVASGTAGVAPAGPQKAGDRPAKKPRRALVMAATVLLLGLGLTAFLVGRSPGPAGGEDGSAAVADQATPPPVEEQVRTAGAEGEDASPAEPADPSVGSPEPVAPEGPGEEPADPAEPVAASSSPATLKLRYENRLREGWITVWIDGKRVWSEEVVGPKSAFKRAVGQDVEATISTTAGDHRIEVRVSEKSMEIDAGDTIRGTFSAGETRQLEVSLKRRSNKLELSWSD